MSKKPDKLDILIGSFEIPGAASRVQRVSKDFKRLEGLVGERVQKVFDTLRWNTTYIMENLAGVYIKENDSYNGNIGLLERNIIDLYFTPNSINVLTRKIGITTPATTNKLLVVQIVDPLKAQASPDIMNLNLTAVYWTLHGLAFLALNLIMAGLFLRSFLFIFSFLNKRLNAKHIVDLLLTSGFFVATLFIEQLKSQDKSQSFVRFTISCVYLGVWLLNRLFGAFMQTEAFKIDTSEIIASYDETQSTLYQACFVPNEPLTYDFLGEKKKVYASMFATKPRHLYQAQIDDILNFVRNYKTRVLIAPHVFAKSVAWSVCEYFKDEMGDRKVFIPMFLLDEEIAVYYYNVKSSKRIIYEIEHLLSKAAIENQLLFYQRNPSKLNLLETDVQSTCVVRSLKVLEEASVHTGHLDHKIALDSYLRFLSAYFIFITCILAITLMIFLVHFIRIRLMPKQAAFRHKLGRPLNEERLLEAGSLNRAALDRLYVDVDSINELIDSRELEIFLNPFQIDIIHEEYELMRAKYKEIRHRIEDRILKMDGHFQTNRKSIAQLHFDLSDPRLPRARKTVLLDTQFNEQIRKQLHHQMDDGSKRVHFRELALKSDPNKSDLNKTSKEIAFAGTNATSKNDRGFQGYQDNYQAYSRHLIKPIHQMIKNKFSKEQFSLSRFLRRFVSGGGGSNTADKPKRPPVNDPPNQSFYWQRLRQRLEAEQRSSDFFFKYSLPNSLDLLMNKYNKKSCRAGPN